MGKLKNEIHDLAVNHMIRMDAGKVGRRFVEAGLEIFYNAGLLKPGLIIVPKLEDDDEDYYGSYSLEAENQTPVFAAHAKGLIYAGPGYDPINAERIPQMIAALVDSGNLFDSYARNHLEKSPPQHEKAKRNLEAAGLCFKALGVGYSPFLTDEERAALKPAQSDSPREATGGAKTLLSLVLEAQGELRGIDIAFDDVPIMKTLVELGYLTRDELTDFLVITTRGKEAIGVRPDGIPDLPVTVANITGNIEERELAARYIDAKIHGVEQWLLRNQGEAIKPGYEVTAFILNEIAHEFRIGMHVPSLVIEGRIIPYNESNDTGLRHAENLQAFYDDVYARNVKAGWWTDLATGLPKKRSVGELFMLFVTEIAEAYEAWADDNASDDKLKDYPGLGVELGDLQIRLADFAGALAAGNIVHDTATHNPGDKLFLEVMDLAHRYEKIRKTPEAVGDVEKGDFLPAMLVGAMVDAKLDFNANRADHKIENRVKEGGKKT